ncbi:hypothetical protein D6D10_08743 [Aureobasidium pullulans]|uniref:F-box domain-containing protein n=1 Tax=Aureobasidium pullulans TaxID=5580 RepID=A0A4S9E7L4_AURPU|nr:hypothetical protein D6D10_08743 [Aureobasidium pullulans]
MRWPNLEQIEFGDWDAMFTKDFLEDVAKRCPGLKFVFFRPHGVNLQPQDLVEFFSKLGALQSVSLSVNRRLLTNDLLLQLSSIQSLTRLELAVCTRKDNAFQHVLDHNPTPFSGLRQATLHIKSHAMSAATQALQNVVGLIVIVQDRGSHILNWISRMASLKFLTVKYLEDVTIDVESLVSLRSLTRLQHLTVEPEDVDGWIGVEHLTDTDFERLVSGLPDLKWLDLEIGHGLTTSALQSLGKHCLQLHDLQISGEWNLQALVKYQAPLFPALTHLHIGSCERQGIERWATASQLAGILDNHAPNLAKFDSRSEDDFSLDVKRAWLAKVGKEYLISYVERMGDV